MSPQRDVQVFADNDVLLAQGVISRMPGIGTGMTTGPLSAAIAILDGDGALAASPPHRLPVKGAPT